MLWTRTRSFGFLKEIIQQDAAHARGSEALRRQFPQKASAIQIARQDANDYLKE
jgi:hypothetical protein